MLRNSCVIVLRARVLNKGLSKKGICLNFNIWQLAYRQYDDQYIEDNIWSYF